MNKQLPADQSSNVDLVITGATGRVGSRIARRLAARGRAVRLLVREPSRAPDLPGARVVAADYADPATAAQALAGARTVFMVSAQESQDRVDVHRAFIDGAVRAGAQQLVYLSFISAAEDSTFTLGRDHWHTEQYARASGLDVTFLRDSLYADFLPMLIGPDGVLRGPGGDGRVAPVTLDDVADAATAVLLDPAAHLGATYGITGPAALTLTEIAQAITRVTGRATRYHNETLEEAYASRASYGAPAWQLESWVSTYTAIARGEFSPVTEDVQRLTGRPATGLDQFLSQLSWGPATSSTAWASASTASCSAITTPTTTRASRT